MSDIGIDRRDLAWLLLGAAALPAAAPAQTTPSWATSWAASAQGPYPSGSPLAMPDQSFALPSPETGASNQSMRMIVRPSVWGRQARIRFTNVFGARPVTFDGAFLGLRHSAATVARGTNRPITFSGRTTVTLAPGLAVWSDPVALPFVDDAASPLLAGRKLAISFHVVGQSGPMTWHAKSLQTSYLSDPNAGARGHEEGEAAFPHGTTAWFFIDALDMMTPAPTPVVVCLGDSITDGTGSTLNGDDRWPDILQRRLHALAPNRIAVVDAGIGANRILTPESYSTTAPVNGGPAALQRLDRDVIGLSGVKTVIWLEGINDLSKTNDATAEAVIAGLRQGVARLRAAIPGVRVVGATITPALGAGGNHGHPEEEQRRQAINSFIRTGGAYDAVADFDRAVVDPKTGGLQPAMVPSSTLGGPGDRLHPNRAGYLAMAGAIELGSVAAGVG